MANDLTRGNVLIADTGGLLSKGPIWIRGFEFLPANAGDAFALLQYKLVTPITNTKKQITATITSSKVLTSNTNLTSIFAQFALLHIIKSTGDVANTKNGGLFLITTAGNNNALTCDDAQNVLTDEASKVYDIEAFVGTVAYPMLSPATDKQSVGRWFGDPGIRFDNLALPVLTSGAKLYLYL